MDRAQPGPGRGRPKTHLTLVPAIDVYGGQFLPAFAMNPVGASSGNLRAPVAFMVLNLVTAAAYR